MFCFNVTYLKPCHTWEPGGHVTSGALLNQDRSVCVSVSGLARLLLFKIAFSPNKALPSRGLCKFFIIHLKCMHEVHEVILEPGVVENGETRSLGSHPFLVDFQNTCLAPRPPSVCRVLRGWQHCPLPHFGASPSRDKDVFSSLAYV